MRVVFCLVLMVLSSSAKADDMDCFLNTENQNGKASALIELVHQTPEGSLYSAKAGDFHFTAFLEAGRSDFEYRVVGSNRSIYSGRTRGQKISRIDGFGGGSSSLSGDISKFKILCPVSF